MTSKTKKNLSQTIVVWDKFIRFFHWNIAFGFLLNYLVIDDNNFLHEWLGYYLLVLLMLRIIWGFWGSHHARFKNFFPSFKLLKYYLMNMVILKEPDYMGHNPVGAVMIMVIIMFLFAISISGWMMGLDLFWGVSWVEDIHYYSSTALFYLIFIHVMGVIYTSWRHKNNLIKSMITGRKKM